VGNAAVGDKFDELGKLLNALGTAATRTTFRNGQPVAGVNLAAIPASMVTHLRGLSDAELKAVAATNTVSLQDGLALPGHPGIGAV
jgi:hypothetical protein